MKLAEIRDLYQDNKFALTYYDSNGEGSLITAHIIYPTMVTIKEDLSVWRVADGNCMINGMKDKDQFHVADDLNTLSEVLEESFMRDYPDSTKKEISWKMAKRKAKKL